MPARIRRRGAAAAAIAAAVLGLPSAASADVSAAIAERTLVVTSDGDGDGIRLRAVEGDEGNVRVRANGGSEQLFSRSLFDRIQVDAGAGDDDITIDPGPIFTNGEPTTVSLGPGNDVFRGANGDETAIGSTGNDTLLGEGGTDTLAGGADDDRIVGGGGTDVVTGGDGDDSYRHTVGELGEEIREVTGRDSLQVSGTSQADRVQVGALEGGLHVRVFGAAATEIGGEGIELVAFAGQEGDDELVSLDDVPAEVFANGSDGDDLLEGGPGGDSIEGGPGNDTLRGKAGSDELFGDEDDDALVGGPGADGLTGGEGVDLFGCDGEDTVFDAEPGESTELCTRPPDPAPEPTPAPEPGPAPGPGAPSAPAPEAPAPDVPAVAPPAPGGGAADLPRGARGFAKPRLVLTRTGVKVVLRSTHSAPIRLRLAATERRGRKLHRYARVTKTVPAGGRVTVALRSPAALLKQLRVKPSARRRPAVTITNLATGGKLTARR